MLNSIAGVFPVDEGSITINDIDVTKMPEYKRAKYIGRVFQDPMVGTAGTCKLRKNLILAMRRGKNLGLKWAFKDSEQAFFKERLALLGLGLKTAYLLVWACYRWSTPIYYIVDGYYCFVLNFYYLTNIQRLLTLRLQKMFCN